MQGSTTTTTPPLPESELQNLLDRYDSVVSAITADPSLALDPSSDEVRAYLALFEPDSEFAQGALASWSDEADEGLTYRRGPAGELVSSTLQEIITSTENAVRFTSCTTLSLEVVDSDGNVIESEGGVMLVEINVVRVGGQWLLQDLSQSTGDCLDPGTD